jgi:anti-anti-sigma regulatory factor/anti-sigma regulatory factor (Ser/Thr protein kinase)
VVVGVPTGGVVECVAEVRFPVSVVRVTGSLDAAAARTLRGFLLGCLADQPVALVLDLSGVSVADDLALTMLPAMGREAAEWPGAELLLCVPDPQVREALDRIGATGQLRVFPVRQEALAVAARRPAAPRLGRRLPASVDAPGLARELLAHAAAAWRLPQEVAQVAQVIATELVSNAVLHAGTAVDFTITLRQDYLHVAAWDGDPSPPRRSTILNERDDHGRGLQLVDGLAAGWGYLPTAGGKVVWASVPVRRG